MDSTETTSTEAYITKEENKKSYASKGLAGTALGLGIAGTALGILNGGLGMFNNSKSSSTSTTADQQYLERKQNTDYVLITKDYYENKLSSLRELTESFYTLDQKIQAAKDAAAAESRENFDALNKRIIDLEKSDAVLKATQPLYNQINDLKLTTVSQNAQSGIASVAASSKNMIDNLGMQAKSWVDFEAERRCCGDNTIVNYANSTFYPRLTADLQTAYTTSFQPIYNPLLRSNLPN